MCICWGGGNILNDEDLDKSEILHLLIPNVGRGLNAHKNLKCVLQYHTSDIFISKHSINVHYTGVYFLLQGPACHFSLSGLILFLLDAAPQSSPRISGSEMTAQTEK